MKFRTPPLSLWNGLYGLEYSRYFEPYLHDYSVQSICNAYDSDLVVLEFSSVPEDGYEWMDADDEFCRFEAMHELMENNAVSPPQPLWVRALRFCPTATAIPAGRT